VCSAETYPWTAGGTNPFVAAVEAGAFLAAVDPDEPSGRFDLLKMEKETHLILSLFIRKGTEF